MPSRKTYLIVAATALVTLLVVIGVLAVLGKLQHPFQSTPNTHVDAQEIQAKITQQSKIYVEREDYDQGVTITQSNAPQTFARFWHTDSTFTAYGYAPVYVDYSQAKITASGDSVTITLPAPEVGDPYVDPQKSVLKDVRCGINVFCHPDEQAFFQAAASVFRTHAESDPNLLAKARADATDFVTKVATDAGASKGKVHVTFAEPAPTPSQTVTPTSS